MSKEFPEKPLSRPTCTVITQSKGRRRQSESQTSGGKGEQVGGHHSPPPSPQPGVMMQMSFITRPAPALRGG